MFSSNTAVLEPLIQFMRVDVVITDRGDLWLLHDQPIGKNMAWVEYDIHDKTLQLVTEDGILQDVGMQVTVHMKPFMEKAFFANLGYVADGKIQSVQEVPVTIRDAGC